MTNTLPIVVIFGSALLGGVAGPAGAAPPRFDVKCSSYIETPAGVRIPVAFHFRFDRVRMLWCNDDCRRTAPMTQQGNRLVIGDPVPGFPHIYDMNARTLMPHGGDRPFTCKVVPFSGFAQRG